LRISWLIVGIETLHLKDVMAKAITIAPLARRDAVGASRLGRACRAMPWWKRMRENPRKRIAGAGPGWRKHEPKRSTFCPMASGYFDGLCPMFQEVYPPAPRRAPAMFSSLRSGKPDRECAAFRRVGRKGQGLLGLLALCCLIAASSSAIRSRSGVPVGRPFKRHVAHNCLRSDSSALRYRSAICVSLRVGRWA
jgi:hypothetical protein